MHRTKAVCEHGLPWFMDCLKCLDMEKFGRGPTTRVSRTEFGYMVEVSNRDEFFRTHPEAAKDLVR